MKKMVLQHTTYQRHREEWTWNAEQEGDVSIHVESRCPGNSPSRSSIDFSTLEAMRQFILLTSSNEGWKVVQGEKEWHSLIEKMDPEFYPRADCETCEFVGTEATTKGLCGELLCADCQSEHSGGSCNLCAQPDVYGV